MLSGAYSEKRFSTSYESTKYRFGSPATETKRIGFEVVPQLALYRKPFLGVELLGIREILWVSTDSPNVSNHGGTFGNAIIVL